MSPERFFKLVVRPTVDEFIKDIHSPRKAILAAIMVYHFPEHVFASRYDDPGDVINATRSYQKEFTGQPWYIAIEQVANAAKHGRRRRDKYDLSRLWDARPSIAGRMVAGRTFIGDREGGVVAAISLEKGSPFVKLHRATLAALERYEADFSELRLTTP